MTMSAALASEAALIGLDKNGEETIVKVQGKKFTRGFNELINEVNDSTVVSLDKYELSGKTWVMNRFEVGLGLKAAFGIGEVLKASATPTVKLVFGR